MATLWRGIDTIVYGSDGGHGRARAGVPFGTMRRPARRALLGQAVNGAREQARTGAVWAAVGALLLGIERPFLPLDLAAAIRQVEALALLGGSQLAPLGIVEGGNLIGCRLAGARLGQPLCVRWN